MNKKKIIFTLIFYSLTLFAALFPVFAEVSEYELKAAFIVKLTGFITWSNTDSVPDFKIAVIGHNPFGKTLEKKFKDKTIQNRKISIKYIESLEDIPDNCCIIFFASSLKKNISEILKKTDVKNTLIIGDTEGYCEKGVLMNFYKEKNNIKFEINKNVLEKSNLKFSYKLLTLARIIQ